jgi:molecular chaperone HscA
VAEERMEAHRIVMATQKALDADRALLEPGERERIAAAIAAVEEAANAGDPGRIHARIEELDKASNPFAARRMNRAIALAIEGKRVDDVTRDIGSESGS